MPRPKLVALALLAAALLAGAALGYAGGRYTGAREFAAGERGAMRRFLAARLDLTPAQITGVDSILDARHREMMRLVAPVQAQLDSTRAATRAQIMARLTPSQQARFQALLAQRDKNRAAAESTRK